MWLGGREESRVWKVMDEPRAKNGKNALERQGEASEEKDNITRKKKGTERKHMSASKAGWFCFMPEPRSC